MALSPQERSRRMRLNMLMGMSYAAFASSKSDPAAALLGTETQGLALDFLQDTYAVRRLPPIGTQTGKAVNFITFSRTSNATVIDSDGVIKWAPHNLLANSESFDSASWSRTGIKGVTANSIAAPNGTTTADLLVEDTTNNVHRLAQSYTSIANSVITVGIFLKQQTVGQNLTIALVAGADSVSEVVSSTDGTSLSSTLTGTSFANKSALSTVSLGSGYYYVSFSVTVTVAATVTILFGIASGTTVAYTGNGTSGIYIWGAHLYRSDLGGMQTNTSAYPMYNPTTSAAYYGPRRDFDPVTLACKGLLVEEQRTNLLLNSATLSTQNVTTTAVAHTLSFYGTGTVTLSGTSTAGPLVGTGAANRVTLTFTPTAGTLTLTVTGSVTQAQLEAGSFATSYIPTGSATATRSADIASVSTAAFPYSSTEGTLVASFNMLSVSNAVQRTVSLGTDNNNEIYMLANNSIGNFGASVISGGANQGYGDIAGATTAVTKQGFAFATNSTAHVVNGGTPVTDATVSMPASPATALFLGKVIAGTSYLNGHIRQITYLPRRISNAELQTRTS